jgi:hypothetical protein
MDVEMDTDDSQSAHSASLAAAAAAGIPESKIRRDYRPTFGRGGTGPAVQVCPICSQEIR